MNTRKDAGVSIEEIEEVHRRAEEALAAVNALLKRLREEDSGTSS